MFSFIKLDSYTWHTDCQFLPLLDHGPHLVASLAPIIETTDEFVAAAICIGAESTPK